MYDEPHRKRAKAPQDTSNAAISLSKKPESMDPDIRIQNTNSAVDYPVIETKRFKGQTIACLKRGNYTYVLLEAIVRIFLPFQSIEHIHAMLVAKHGTGLACCTKNEELAFIQFYQISTDKLQNTALVEIHVLDAHIEYLIEEVNQAKSLSKFVKLL